jgi:hypothetical protein
MSAALSVRGGSRVLAVRGGTGFFSFQGGVPDFWALEGGVQGGVQGGVKFFFSADWCLLRSELVVMILTCSPDHASRPQRMCSMPSVDVSHCRPRAYP